ncbi:hypothetical protein OQA88_5682 [Cercophora sp. LCS_1]
MAADIGTLAAAAYPSPPNYSSPPHQSSYDRAAMSSSLSPNPASQSSYSGGSPAPAAQDKSPLSSLNLNFLKTLTEKRTTRDGQPPKRRGPKPDSKPALTRRQELNRQAQRTHRERKELYIKALEDEVLRLKEVYSNVSQDKEKLVEENRQLKALLTQGGGLGGGLGNMGSSLLDDSMSNPSVGYASSASVTGSYAPAPSSNTSAFTPPLSATNMVPPHSRGTGSAPSPHASSHQHSGPHSHHHHQHSGQGQHLGSGGSSAGGQAVANPSVDYDQAGIDFVLTYDHPSQAYIPHPPHHPGQ